MGCRLRFRYPRRRPALSWPRIVAGEALAAHRDRYDDWSLPKGKLDPGESLLQCALREVAEETDLHCAPGDHLADITYVDHRGRTKLVRYWEMTVVDGRFAPNDEVDEVRWLAVGDLRRILSYDHDEAVVDRFESLLLERDRDTSS